MLMNFLFSFSQKLHREQKMLCCLLKNTTLAFRHDKSVVVMTLLYGNTRK